MWFYPLRHRDLSGSLLLGIVPKRVPFDLVDVLSAMISRDIKPKKIHTDGVGFATEFEQTRRLKEWRGMKKTLRSQVMKH